MSAQGAPANVDGPSRHAFWTGERMIVADRSFARSDNAIYDPCLDGWSPMGPAPKHHPGLAGTVLSQWVGDRLVLWSRPSKASGLDWIVLEYDPGTDTWSDSSVPPALPPVTVVGRHLLMFEGQESFHDYAAARIHHLDGGRTEDVSATGAPEPRFGAVETVLDDHRFLVWGGQKQGGNAQATGAILDLEKNAWTPMSTKDAPWARSMAGHEWTGSRLIVWGSLAYMSAGGGIYDPQTDTWTPMTEDGDPGPRSYFLTAVSGDRFLVLGGYLQNMSYPDGGVYDMTTHTWSQLPMPENVDQTWSAVHVLDDGRIVVRHRDLQWMHVLDPVGLSWSEVDASDVGPRGHAGVVFTGMKLVVWGGMRFQSTANPCKNAPPDQGCDPPSPAKTLLQDGWIHSFGGSAPR